MCEQQRMFTAVIKWYSFTKQKWMLMIDTISHSKNIFTIKASRCFFLSLSTRYFFDSCPTFREKCKSEWKFLGNTELCPHEPAEMKEERPRLLCQKIVITLALLVQMLIVYKLQSGKEIFPQRVNQHSNICGIQFKKMIKKCFSFLFLSNKLLW